jgi:hypothetical protein
MFLNNVSWFLEHLTFNGITLPWIYQLLVGADDYWVKHTHHKE